VETLRCRVYQAVYSPPQVRLKTKTVIQSSSLPSLGHFRSHFQWSFIVFHSSLLAGGCSRSIRRSPFASHLSSSQSSAKRRDTKASAQVPLLFPQPWQSSPNDIDLSVPMFTFSQIPVEDIPSTTAQAAKHEQSLFIEQYRFSSSLFRTVCQGIRREWNVSVESTHILLRGHRGSLPQPRVQSLQSQGVKITIEHSASSEAGVCCQQGNPYHLIMGITTSEYSSFVDQSAPSG
jgi:hypothetical protein